MKLKLKPLFNLTEAKGILEETGFTELLEETGSVMGGGSSGLGWDWAEVDENQVEEQQRSLNPKPGRRRSSLPPGSGSSGTSSTLRRSRSSLRNSFTSRRKTFTLTMREDLDTIGKLPFCSTMYLYSHRQCNIHIHSIMPYLFCLHKHNVVLRWRWFSQEQRFISRLFISNPKFQFSQLRLL